MSLRIGTGAGFSGDRIGPAVDIAKFGNLDYLVFECLAERTIAKAQLEHLKHPELGFDPLLRQRILAVLPHCVRNKTRIITNMGAANPIAAAECARQAAQELGIFGLRIAAVCGDDVLHTVQSCEIHLSEIDKTTTSLGDRMVSANAYVGVASIVDALKQGADIVITGRAADPAMFLAPQVLEFGWAMDDWERLGKGTLTGHLLECAAQVTGGYFADPGVKNVPNIANLGFPIAEIEEDGNAIITKTPGSGGFVTEATCKEQLLYEIHDPSRYFQPDVVADFSNVTVNQIGENRVAIAGGSGTKKTGSLKVSVGYLDSWAGEGQISYAGINALARGELAIDILNQRFASEGIEFDEVKSEMIGINSIFGEVQDYPDCANEVRVRFVGRCQSMETALRVGQEVESLYLNGPAGGGGVTTSTRHLLAVASALIPEEQVTQTVTILES